MTPESGGREQTTPVPIKHNDTVEAVQWGDGTYPSQRPAANALCSLKGSIRTLARGGDE
jgi:hypothetical protein